MTSQGLFPEELAIFRKEEKEAAAQVHNALCDDVTLSYMIFLNNPKFRYLTISDLEILATPEIVTEFSNPGFGFFLQWISSYSHT